MKLLEHEAKNILKSFGVNIPKSELLKTPKDTLTIFPVVLKSQVLSGRRNQFSGIQIIRDDSVDLPSAVRGVFAANIDGVTAVAVLAEEMVAIKKEFYLSFMINKTNSTIELLAHNQGGVEIEDEDYSDFLHLPISEETVESTGMKLAEYYGCEDMEFALSDLLTKLLDCFQKSDASLLEINPLVITASDTFVAVDCKMILDDMAAFRHTDWDFYDTSLSHNFVTLNEQGSVATIANGAGLAMATVDAVEDAGLTAANFLDIGGGANKETVLASFNKIMEYSQVQAILINIFAGITRCDEVARAIIAASEEIPTLPSLYVRLEGTNLAEAQTLLEDHDLTLYTTLPEALAQLQKEVSV